MHPTASPSSVIDTVGRRGALRYEFAAQARRTVLAQSSCSSPWHYFPPSSLDDSGCLYTWLVNPSGGLVGGDQVTVDARLQPGAHVVMTSPSANRVYRSLGEPAVQDVRVTVGAGSILEWLPELTIPFAGSRFRQSIHVDLAPGATVVLWDAMASGRIAMKERWRFTDYDNEIVIRTAAGPGIIERYAVIPESVGAVIMDWDYVGSLFVVGERLEKGRLDELAAVLHGLCEAQPGELLGGVSEPPVTGLVVKVVARSAPALTALLESAWREIRVVLWGLPAPMLRRY
ncbi:MAG: urease accessory protein UreD [Nitrospira sp.]